MRTVLYASIVTLLIAFPKDTAVYAAKALHVWIENIVPTLFPYMVFSRMLSQRLNTHNASSIPAALLGIMGGSPNGSMLIASISANLSRRVLYTLCAFCGTISPMFILGTLQTWTGDPLFCRLLLSVHWLSALLSAGIVWALERGCLESPLADKQAPPYTNNRPIAQSIDAIMQVGGCIICYSVLAGFTEKLLPDNTMLHPLFHSILEISGGSHAIVESSLSLKTKFRLLSATLSFSGISILAQNHAFLSPLGISMTNLVSFAVIRAACAFVCAAILF